MSRVRFALPPLQEEDADISKVAGLFGSGAAASSSSATATQGDISKDMAVSEPPTDSISAIRFSPQAELLAVSSWDKKVRIYEVASNGSTIGKSFFDHEAPVLNCCWSADGTKVFGAGADKAVRMHDLQSGGNTAVQVAAHDEPIRCVESIEIQQQPMLVTGSWDKTIKYWDLRSAQPAATVTCQDRVYSMSVKNAMLVVATADRWINVINLANPNAFYKQIQSPLKWQTRVVSCFADATGFAIGSIEGRCAIQYVEDKDSGSNFSFKCHRQNVPNQRDVANVYSVNAISFHPEHGTFSTAGSDGTFHFWDKDAKHRLKGYPEVGGTISATDFNRTGSIFAYAVSYDWSKGYAHNNNNLANKIMLHPVQPDECKPRPGGKKR